MSTFSEMKDAIADYISRSDLSTQIGDAVNRAITHYSSRRFWFNETTGTMSTVASQQSYGTSDSLPSDIAKLDAVQVTVNGTKYTLTPRTYNYIIDVNTSSTSTTGQPCDFAWYQGKIWFYPTPDDVYTVTFSYQKTYSELSADSDTNDFTTYAEDLIEARAMWWVYSRIIKDRDGALASKQDEIDALSSLSKRTNSMLRSGSLRASQF